MFLILFIIIVFKKRYSDFFCSFILFQLKFLTTNLCNADYFSFKLLRFHWFLFWIITWRPILEQYLFVYTDGPKLSLRLDYAVVFSSREKTFTPLSLGVALSQVMKQGLQPNVIPCFVSHSTL